MARELVRTRLSASAGTRRPRTLDERVFVRFPPLLRSIVSTVMRLSPRSRVRQAFLSRLIRAGWAASDRGDLDLSMCLIDPNVEVSWPETGRWAFPDLSGTHHGHDGWLRVWRAIHELFDVAIRPEEIIDAGDRLLVFADATALGIGSGVRLSGPLISVVTIHGGRLVREEYFNEREDALTAAGIRPEDLGGTPSYERQAG
jgi:ketosteroid isomerase-like protein